MARVTISRTQSSRKALDTEIARLRDLSIRELQARWRVVFRQEAPAHLPRHFLFRTLVYRLQANAFGDLDDGAKRLLEKMAVGESNRGPELKPIVSSSVQKGTILSREWRGRMHRVAVLAGGFAWNGKTYPSLSKVAFEITGTRWNGPRFFGLRDKSGDTADIRS
jgi:hypothetical protein